MFTKVEVTNSQGALLTLQLGDTTNGINVLEVAGLDPVKATLVTNSFANQDGVIYLSSRRDARNITMKLGFDPDPATTTLRALRSTLFSFFRPKSQIKLKFFVDDTDDVLEDGYVIFGRVETSTSPMFSQEPEVDVSIMCFDPDFIDPVPVVVSGMTTADTTPTYFPYNGTSETGIVFSLNVTAALSEFVLYYTDANLAVSTMDIAGVFLAGDQITIGTVPGSKYATLVRGGVSSSVLFAVSPQSVWPQLAPGDNWFRVVAAGPAMPASITYTKRFGEL